MPVAVPVVGGGGGLYQQSHWLSKLQRWSVLGQDIELLLKHVVNDHCVTQSNDDSQVYE